MNALLLTLFVSLVLVAAWGVFFVAAFRRRDQDHGDRLSLLPLSDD
jgi:heme/copper-type cytochrome/quinol oxidase subunit 2